MQEFTLLQKIFRDAGSLPDWVTIPPGDDMAAIRLGDQTLLIAADQVVDGVHLHLSSSSLEQMARKAIIRNVSDIAAMGAEPLASIATVAAPSHVSDEQGEKLYRALARYAAEYAVPLIGGDISSTSGPLSISVTVLARAEYPPICRNTARAGDVIMVTGPLGGAWDEQGGGPHLTAEPRLALARQLAALPHDHRPTAMIDLSDGLAGDLGHIARSSGLSAQIDIDRLPLRPQAHDRARQSGRTPWEHAMIDGEDYELCFTASSEAAAQITQNFSEQGVVVIGKMVDKTSDTAIYIRSDRAVTPYHDTGWQHD